MVDDEDEIVFKRLKRDYNNHKKKQARDKDYEDDELVQTAPLDDDEDELFVPDTRPKPAPPTTFCLDSGASDADVSIPKQKRKRSGKPHPSSRSKKKAKITPIKTKPPTKRQQQQVQNLANLNTLGNSSVFTAAQTNTARKEQPGFTDRRKDVAFKELIASIPEESRSTAKVDVKQLRDATKKFTGQGSCYSDEKGGWIVKGMESSLTHYQMLGVSFMREREDLDSEAPHGGLLADEMGLGKTVMSIANIANDSYSKPKSKANRMKGPNLPPTLIVAPSSIIHQWVEELKKHATPGTLGSIMKFSLPGIAMHDDPEAVLVSQGVVITSFAQVSKSYPKQDPPLDLQSAAEKSTWWEKYFQDHKGLLHRISWRRVILDEATNIKNHNSRAAAACTELQADFKWALSGTPAMNSLDEFYSYFRFLQVPNISSFRAFKKNFTNDETGLDRLIGFLRPFMLRRTHNDSILGAKLLDLPPPSRDTYICKFNPFEQQLYKIVHDRFIDRINRFSKTGELGKSYRNILVLVLRMRQLTGHPLLIQDTMRELLEKEDFIKIEELLNQFSEDPRSEHGAVILHLRHMLRDPQNLPQVEKVDNIIQRLATNGEDYELSHSQEGSSPGASTEQHDHGTGGTGGAFGAQDHFRQYLEDVKQNKKVDELAEDPTICVKCNQEAQDPTLTSCGHTYCVKCLLRLESQSGAKDRNHTPCLRCGSFFTGKLPWVPGSKMKQSKTAEPKNPNAPKAADAAARRKSQKDIIEQWITPSDNMLPSAKTLAFKGQMLNWIQENPKVKVIVYTQFTSMIYILARICEIEKWTHVSYHGSINLDRRHNAIQKFKCWDKGPVCLLATMKAGGIGLNLTMATRVIIME